MNVKHSQGFITGQSIAVPDSHSYYAVVVQLALLPKASLYPAHCCFMGQSVLPELSEKKEGRTNLTKVPYNTEANTMSAVVGCARSSIAFLISIFDHQS